MVLIARAICQASRALIMDEPTAEPTAEPEPVSETREFTDSVGRTVTVPNEVTKVAVSGPLTQIVLWDPDVILFASGSVYATAAEDEMWKNVRAIKEGNYYEVPFGPYNWMGFPPSVQRYMGMLWMAKLLYGDAADYDMYEKTAEYFKLFYHCDLTQEQYDALIANSIAKIG